MLEIPQAAWKTMGSLFPGLVALKQVDYDEPLQLLQQPTDPLQAWLTPEPPAIPTSAYICPDCVTEQWVTVEEEEAICRKCGYSFGYEVTSSAEYRWFGTEDRSPDPSRVGNPMNPLLPESSLGTRIVARPGESRAMQKIRQYHLWNVMPYRERTLWNVFEGLQVRAANAGISAAILEETKQLYAQVSPLCICRGQQKEALMAACLFESLKRHDTPRRPGEIAEIFKIDMKLITRGVKQFAGLLDEHLHAAARKAVEEDAAATAATSKTTTPTITTNTSNTKDVEVTKAPVILQPVATPSTNFRHYLEPAILRLDTPRALLGAMEDKAIHFGNLLDELGICPETTPPSLAACSIALATQHLGFPKTNQEIAGVCGISLATLQKCMKRIEPWKPTLFKPSGGL
jgi:transcription initiation factor TFIIIB Brf1 subunit/transcription initiation factor TFIIB